MCIRDRDLIQKAEEENVSFYDKINELTKDIPIGSEKMCIRDRVKRTPGGE